MEKDAGVSLLRLFEHICWNILLHGYGLTDCHQHKDFHTAYGRQGYKWGYNMKCMKYKSRKVYIFGMEKGVRKPFIILKFYLHGFYFNTNMFYRFIFQQTLLKMIVIHHASHSLATVFPIF